MRLERLTLSGFKSFADATEVRFDAPINGIVGPNGCGKSNVVEDSRLVVINLFIEGFANTPNNESL